MKAADWPRQEPERTRLLVVDAATGSVTDRRLEHLPALLAAGDLLVVNDAGTLPASLPARTRRGRAVEVRLAAHAAEDQWWAALLGPGDWRQRTEDRPPPPPVAAGERLAMGSELEAEVMEVDRACHRLLRLRFDRGGAAFWGALYRWGRPVQYSHLRERLELWHVQTRYRGRPWAVEMPSGGQALTAALLTALRRRGVRVAPLTHAAGLSSIGDATLDAHLPLPERYDVPAATVQAVERTRARGGRVVAVGTTVVRALESAAQPGPLWAGTGIAVLRVGPGHRRRVVDAVLTGLHEPRTTHFELLTCLAPRPLLQAALRYAGAEGYLAHEFGDAALVLSAPDGAGATDRAEGAQRTTFNVTSTFSTSPLTGSAAAVN